MMGPAAFGRLCVETFRSLMAARMMCQPPSGGCVLKPPNYGGSSTVKAQPPSGGCVLKLSVGHCRYKWTMPAAFGRLCVETPC